MSTPGATPFSIKLPKNKQSASALSLLPATTRTAHNDIQVPFVTDGALVFLGRDLLVDRLNDVHSSLWMAGRPMPPRHLGHQVVLSRELVVTEDMGLHLVWEIKRMFIKPLPRYLLDEGFWSRYLVDDEEDSVETKEQRRKIAQCARGFLLSYCALISHESDFKLAQTLGVLPNGLEWHRWRSWVAEIVSNCPYSSVNQRFWYGELRLGRLNKIYRWQKGHILRRYSQVGAPSVYSELLHENFAALAVSLGYIVIVLTAMQVGLATDHFQHSAAFQRFSWVFTVMSLIAPLAAVIAILVLFLIIFIGNWTKTKRFEKERSEAMGVQVQAWAQYIVSIILIMH
ncbi:hypothetical protein Q7P36_009409 [Cladosporium allicinum]